MLLQIILASCIPIAYVTGYLAGKTNKLKEWTDTLNKKTEEERKKWN